MSQSIISVIVPFHNVEAYFEQCLRSLVGQTVGVESMQIILVDDASTDSSARIAEDFRQRYPASVEVFSHDVSRGPGEARNTGLHHAKSEIIAFVDADDYIDENMYSVVADIMKRESVDIVLFPHIYFDDNSSQVELVQHAYNPGYSIFETNKRIPRSLLAAHPLLFYNVSIVTKVFRKDLLDRIGGFPATRHIAEDALISITAFALAKAVYVTNEVSYHYRKHAQQSLSIMDQAFSDPKLYHDHLATNRDLCELKRVYPELSQGINWFNVLSSHGYVVRLLLGRLPVGAGPGVQRKLYEAAKKVYADIPVEGLPEPVSDAHIRVVRSVQRSRTLADAKRRFLYTGMLNRVGGYMFGLRKKHKLHSKVRTAREAFDMLFYVASHRLFRSSSDQVWLFGENNEARDNAYELFRYVQEEHKEITAYYAIDRSSPDFHRVSGMRNVVARGSRKHKKAFMAAGAVLSTHTRGSLEPWRVGIIDKLAKGLYEQKRYVFLQHGVIYSDLGSVLDAHSGSAGKIDVFITSADREKEYVVRDLHRPPSTVHVTGLPRWDMLKESVDAGGNSNYDHVVAYMPTWRRYAMQTDWELHNEGAVRQDSTLLASQYYRYIQGMINHPALEGMLARTNTKMLVYLHKECQKYQQYFFAQSPHIQVVQATDYTPQEMPRLCSGLITDYSSIFFDFAAAGKPVLYAQFDSEEYEKGHSAPGYFDFKEDGFGPVSSDPDSVVSNLERYTKTNFTPDKEYVERAKKFLTSVDGSHRRRAFDAILKDIKQK